jgi:hypothetical protein
MRNRSLSVLSGAVVLSFGWAVFLSTPAVAHTYERCDADGDHCVRVKCDRDGDKCWKESAYARKEVYHHPGRWVCDADGDRCHYAYTGRNWNPRHWDRDDDEHH